MQTVHLNIAWLSSDSKIYLAKRAAAKRTAQVTHRTIRSLVSKPDEHCGNLECPRKPTTSILRALARAWWDEILSKVVYWRQVFLGFQP